jgi:dihydropteroate synthase
MTINFIFFFLLLLSSNFQEMNSKDTFFSKKTTLNCGGKLLDLSTPRIMGILNITPDSFYDGGRYVDEGQIARRVDELISEGADIIDIGGYSSRPGASDVTAPEEMKRISKALEYIRKQYPEAIVSVDTFRSEIAKTAIEKFKADIINDITAGLADPLMFETAAAFKVPYIMMHMKGTPATMQINPEYDDLLNEIIGFFRDRISKALASGINDIIIDPGFGFGKTIEHNYQLLRNLQLFSVFGLPVMAGFSRKSMIYKYLCISPEDSLNGTTVLNTLALLNGANLLRVHDVKEAKETIALYKAYMSVESIN